MSSHPLSRMLELSAVFMLLTFVVFVGYGLFAAWIRRHVITRPGVLTWMRRTFAAAFVAPRRQARAGRSLEPIPLIRHSRVSETDERVSNRYPQPARFPFGPRRSSICAVNSTVSENTITVVPMTLISGVTPRRIEEKT